MAELKTFDFTGALGRGLALGQAIRQQENQGKLAALLGQARTTSGPQRDALMGQAYGVDPGVGMAADQSFGKVDEGRMKHVGLLANLFVNMTPEQRAQAWPSVRQQVGTVIPEVQYKDMWDESLLPQAKQIAQMFSGLVGDELKSLAVGKNGNFHAIRGNQFVDLGVPAAPNTQVIMQPGQLPYSVTTGRGVPGDIHQFGQPQQQGYAPQQPAPQQQAPQQGQMGEGSVFASLEAIPGTQVTSGQRTPEHNARVGGVANSYHLTGQARDILPPSTPEQAQQIQQFAAQNGLEIIDEGDHWHLEPIGRGAPAGGPPAPGAFPGLTGPQAGPVRIPLPAETAAAEERARQQAQLDYLPQRQAIETRGAIDQMRAEQSVERIPPPVLTILREAEEKAGVADSIIRRMDRHREKIRSGDLQFGPVANQLAKLRNLSGESSEQSRNYQLFVSDLEKMRNDSLRLNNGVQTEGDAQRAWNELFANLNDTQYVLDGLERIEEINRDAAEIHRRTADEIRQSYPGQQGGQAPTARRARNPQTGEELELRDGQWVPVR